MAPARADELEAVERWYLAVVPGGQQIVEHRVELFLRRIPRLVQVVVDARGVDGANGGFSVGIGSQEHALGVGIERDGLLEELDAGHAGHALVADDERDDVVALLELAADVECGLSGGGAQDAVVLAVLAAQVLHDSLEYADVVVHCEKNRFGHT